MIFIVSLIDGHLAFLYFLTAINNAAWTFICKMFSVLLGIYLGVTWLGHMVPLCLIFWGTVKLFSTVTVPFYQSKRHEYSNLPTSLPTLVIVCLFDYGHPGRCEGVGSLYFNPHPRICLLILGREKEGEILIWERNIKWLPPIWVLTGNWICMLGMCPDWMMLQPTEPSSQGKGWPTFESPA